ncbi:MAG: hypothetical protein P9L94_10320 [Candidatus Hinthialibacter antarcticus]|nr:hypothetical protein [Candidatus Hinthialibacter antarcticus]
MNQRTLQNVLYSTHIALVVILPACVAFLSLTRMHFRAEQERSQFANLPVQLAVRTAPGEGAGRLNALANSINSIDGVNHVNLVSPIPAWQGDDEYQDEWASLWQANSASIIYVTAEQAADPISAANRLQEEIAALGPFQEIVWNRDDFQESESERQILRQHRTHMTWMLLVLLFAASAGLALSYPLRFRRRFVVRTGGGGAGSQVSPEMVWGAIMLVHCILAVLMFVLLFFLGYVTFTFPLAPDGRPSVFALFIQGVFCTAALTAAVSAIGWWLPTDEIDAVNLLRPPSIPWDRED